MMLDLERFLRQEQPAWSELEALLDELRQRASPALSLEESDRLLALYRRAITGLNRLQHGASALALTASLERLVARAYGEIYQTRPSRRCASRRRPAECEAATPGAVACFHREPLLRRIAATVTLFPVVFRRHAGAFLLALLLTMGGMLFGALAVGMNPHAARRLLPAAYLRHPQRRIASEARLQKLGNPYEESVFSSFLMSHNISTSILALLLGLSLGVGTSVVLVENGILLGAVVMRYASAGAGVFTAAWLLPHGAFEIPAVLIAGQGGFMLAAVLLRGDAQPRRRRLRALLPELWTLIFGFSAMLVWAGLIEAFFSQRLAAQTPYAAKIAFGLVELAALAAWLAFAGRVRNPASVLSAAAARPAAALHADKRP